MAQNSPNDLMENQEEINSLNAELANLKSREEGEGLTVMEIKQHIGGFQARLATLLGIERKALESYMHKFHSTTECMDYQIQAKMEGLLESSRNAVSEAESAFNQARTELVNFIGKDHPEAGPPQTKGKP